MDQEIVRKIISLRHTLHQHPELSMQEVQTKGILMEIATEDVREYEKGLFSYLDTDAEGAAAMAEIRSSGALSEETEERLRNALESYTKNFVAQRPEK